MSLWTVMGEAGLPVENPRLSPEGRPVPDRPNQERARQPASWLPEGKKTASFIKEETNSEKLSLLP